MVKEKMSEKGVCGRCVTCQKGYAPQQVQRGPNVQGRQMQRGMGQQKTFPVYSLTTFVNRKCNLRCKYCFLWNYERDRSKKEEMSWDTAQKMITWLIAASRDRPRPGIHWFGYEPLMSFDLIKKTTEWANSLLEGTHKQMKWGMTTNLTLVTQKTNAFLKKHDYYVLCSLDGPKESHDKYRVYEDGRGSWDDAVRGLKRLMTWNKNRTVRWTVEPETLKYVVPGTQWLLDLGIRNIAHEFVYEMEWKKKDLENMETEFGKLIPIVVDYAKRNERLDFKFFRDGQRCFKNTRMTDRCGRGYGDVGINPEGTFFRCHRFVDQPEHAIGSIWKGLDVKKVADFNRTWGHDKIVAWDGTKETCMKCIARMGCNAGCLAVNWDTMKSLYQPPRSHCDISVSKVKVAIRLSEAMRKAGLPKKQPQSCQVNRR